MTRWLGEYTRNDVTVRFKKSGDGVYYTTDALGSIDADAVSFLKEEAVKAFRGRARICLHPTPQSKQHDMLIVTRRNSYVAPHYHSEKSETFVLLAGKCSYLVFSEEGRLKEIIDLQPFDKNGRFLVRTPPKVCHGLVVHSEEIVFLESTTGPFKPEAMTLASWAPAEDDVEAIQCFRNWAEQQVSANTTGAYAPTVARPA